MPETRCYLVIDAAAPRLEEQWQLLITGLKAKPMSAAIIERAQASPYNTVHINRYSLDYQYMLGDFEMAESEREYLLGILEAQRIAQGVSEGLSVRETYRRVTLEEIREVAIETGYPALAPLLGLEIPGFGQRLTAIADIRAWMYDVSRVGNWEP